jgi:hypothetical protein
MKQTDWLLVEVALLLIGLTQIFFVNPLLYYQLCSVCYLKLFHEDVDSRPQVDTSAVQEVDSRAPSGYFSSSRSGFQGPKWILQQCKKWIPGPQVDTSALLRTDNNRRTVI